MSSFCNTVFVIVMQIRLVVVVVVALNENKFQVSKIEQIHKRHIQGQRK